MSYCEDCGSPLGPNAKFCSNCGATAKKPDSAQAEKPKEVSSPDKGSSVKTESKKPKGELINYYSPPTGRVIPQAPFPIISSSQPAQPQVQMSDTTPQPTYFQAPTPAPTFAAPMTQPQMPSQPVPVAQPQLVGETVVGVILFRKPKSMGRWDTFAGVVTTDRLIFAQITNQMVTDAAMQAREKAKAEGKGFFGQWGDQLRNTFGFTNRYLTMNPDSIVAETPGNFFLLNSQVTDVKVSLRGQYNDNSHREFEVNIYGGGQKYSYHMDENSEYTDKLKRVYGDRVHMPFGYFSKSVNIKF